MYRYMNKNPNQLNVDDCSIRSLSTVLGISWADAYDMLSDSARDLGLMMSSVQAVEEFLDLRYNRVPIYENTVGEFIKNNPKGKFLITMPNHITALVDGYNYDTFDSSEREIWSAWYID